MNTYLKILLTTLPLVLAIFSTAIGISFYFSRVAISELAETWLDTRLTEAIHIAYEQEEILHKYGLEKISASIAKAKMDTVASVANIKIGNQGFIFALDNNGTIVMHPEVGMLGKNVAETDWFKNIKPERGRLQYKNQAKMHFAIYDRFEPWNWTIIVTDPEDEVYRVVNRMKPFIISIALTGSLMLALALMFLARKLTQPLRALTTGAERIGQGDLTTRIPIQSKDEYGHLAEVFNQMSFQLEQSHEQLEQRVATRTKELTQTNDLLQREIEERKLAVTALHDSEQWLRAILRASPVGISLVVDRKLSWANETLYNIFGYEPDSLTGRNTHIFYHNDDEYERVGRLLYQDISRTETALPVEARMKTKSGELITCNLSAYPLDPDNPSGGIIVAVTDMSEAKILEARLQQAKKMEAIGTLAGGVAHDLNNILSGIVSYPELLLLDLPANSPLHKPLKTIQRSGERAAMVVQDLLTMARRGVSTSEVVNLNDIISEQLQSPEFKQLKRFHSDIKVIPTLSASIFNTRGSSAHLAKSIMNLISNAAEAMPEGGTITITTRNTSINQPTQEYANFEAGEYVSVSVADTGTGIANEDMERIFEPFYTKKKMGRSGTGLGMAVVWGTVQDHGGFIDIKSSEDKGTTITLFFPASYEAVDSTEQIPDLEKFSGNGKSVLVIDDDDVQREIAQNILKKLGYKVFSVAGGEQAVEFLKKNSVDLLIIDMIMPDGMSGLDTYREIAILNPNQKIIVASGFSETDKVKELMRLSGGQYLKKPYSISAIGEALTNSFNNG